MNWVSVALEVIEAIETDLPSILQIVAIIKACITGKRAPTTAEWQTIDGLADANNKSLEAIANKYGVTVK